MYRRHEPEIPYSAVFREPTYFTIKVNEYIHQTDGADVEMINFTHATVAIRLEHYWKEYFYP